MGWGHRKQRKTGESLFCTKGGTWVGRGWGGGFVMGGGGGDAVIETLWDIPVLMFPNKNCKLMDFLGNLGWLYFFI